MRVVTVSVKEKSTNRRAVVAVLGDYNDYYSPGQARDRWMTDLKHELVYPEAYDLRTIRTHDNILQPMRVDLDRPVMLRLENIEEDFAARFK
jgi:hypothetical protein